MECTHHKVRLATSHRQTHVRLRQHRVAQHAWQPRRLHRHHCRSLQVCAVSGIAEGELISSEDDFKKAVGQKRVVVVDWMAKWCRKCIYLKPKLEKMMDEDYGGIPLVFIDVNAVPGGLVYGNGIRKMPTITIYRDGEKVREHIAIEGGLKAVSTIRDMIKEYFEVEMDVQPGD